MSFQCLSVRLSSTKWLLTCRTCGSAPVEPFIFPVLKFCIESPTYYGHLLRHFCDFFTPLRLHVPSWAPFEPTPSENPSSVQKSTHQVAARNPNSWMHQETLEMLHKVVRDPFLLSAGNKVCWTKPKPKHPKPKSLEPNNIRNRAIDPHVNIRWTIVGR